LSVSQLTEETCRELEIALMFAATPPNIHIADAIRAQELGVQTYIEKPAYPAGYGAEKRPIIEQALSSGKVGLIDFFLGNRALIDFLDEPQKFLSGQLIAPNYSLGEIEYIHATCLEPHSVNEEGARRKMLMSFEAQGGFLYADQAPHPLAIMEATLNSLFRRSLTDSAVAATYRTRETAVSGPEDAETGGAVLRVLDTSQFALVPSRPRIELLSVVGKGLPVIGGADQVALPNYMLTIGCTEGRLDICVGNGQNTLPSYLSLTPSDPTFPTRMFEYTHSGLGYSLILADLVIAAQAQRQGVEVPAETAARLDRHTNASMAAMRSIEEVYQLWNRNSSSLQHYGEGEPMREPKLPPELPLSCFIHGHIREDESRRVGRDLLKQS
jgi:hypothetical protein